MSAKMVAKSSSRVILQLFGDNLVLEANRDITKPMKIEVELGESEQQLRWLASLVESSDDAIVSKSRWRHYKLEQRC